MSEIQELKKKLKTHKATTGILAGLILVMIVISILSLINNKVTFSTYLPLFFLPMLIINLSEIKKLRNKVKSKSE